ncbi:hypothetical protein PR202_ga20840 [Eleusine coracana subsp. coracana]|uniref:Uncharacterized protein n=1 Tax=Eleusine coracana subsp. coracana TaxID=191504 RepID=A0AAV5CYD4_ELECO|nr:hypothetical protein PR202_ga20840 [Eleusine coracana subsp. coracana]
MADCRPKQIHKDFGQAIMLIDSFVAAEDEEMLEDTSDETSGDDEEEEFEDETFRANEEEIAAANESESKEEDDANDDTSDEAEQGDIGDMEIVSRVLKETYPAKQCPSLHLVEESRRSRRTARPPPPAGRTARTATVRPHCSPAADRRLPALLACRLPSPAHPHCSPAVGRHPPARRRKNREERLRRRAAAANRNPSAACGAAVVACSPADDGSRAPGRGSLSQVGRPPPLMLNRTARCHRRWARSPAVRRQCKLCSRFFLSLRFGSRAEKRGDDSLGANRW